MRTRIDGFLKQRSDGAVTQGGVVNALGLLGAAGEYGETVVEAVARAPTLVLTLRASAFEAALGSLPGDVLGAVRKVAAARARLLGKAALNKALPALSDAHVQAVAVGAETLVLLREGEVLLAPSSAGGGSEGAAEARGKKGAKAKSRRKVSDVPRRGSESWGLHETMFILAKGQLLAEGTDGLPLTLAEGAVFTTPLLTEAAPGAPVVVSGTAQAPPCIVVRLATLLHPSTAFRGLPRASHWPSTAFRGLPRASHWPSTAFDQVRLDVRVALPLTFHGLPSGAPRPEGRDGRGARVGGGAARRGGRA